MTLDRRLVPLLILNLLLVLLVALELRPLPTATETARITLPAETVLPELTMPTLGELAQTRDRPPFTEGRKPAKADGSAASWSGQLKLTGVVVSAGGRLAVVVRADKPGPALRLVQGSAVDGWVVEEIGPRSVTFTRDGERHLLPLVETVKKTEGPKP